MEEKIINATQLFSKINHKIILPNDQTISIYTILRILDKMRREMGLEVTLEYLEHYIAEIEKAHLAIKGVTDKVLEIMDIDRIFRELMN